MNLAEDMTALATAAKNAARLMPRLNTDQKNLCLNTMADAVEAQAEAIQTANALDMETAREMKLSQSMMDRLLLNEQRIAGMAQGLREVAELPDPVGRMHPSHRVGQFGYLSQSLGHAGNALFI